MSTKKVFWVKAMLCNTQSLTLNPLTKYSSPSMKIFLVIVTLSKANQQIKGQGVFLL